MRGRHARRRAELQTRSSARIASGHPALVGRPSRVCGDSVVHSPMFEGVGICKAVPHRIDDVHGEAYRGVSDGRRRHRILTGHAPPTRLPRPTPRFAGMAAASSRRLGWRNHEAAWSRRPSRTRWCSHANRVAAEDQAQYVARLNNRRRKLQPKRWYAGLSLQCGKVVRGGLARALFTGP